MRRFSEPLFKPYTFHFNLYIIIKISRSKLLFSKKMKWSGQRAISLCLVLCLVFSLTLKLLHYSSFVQSGRSHRRTFLAVKPTPVEVMKNLESEIFMIGNKAYFCKDLRPNHTLFDRDQESPSAKCLGGMQSWGTCQNGAFLCELGNTSMLEPQVSNLRHCVDASSVPFEYECIDSVCKVSWFRYDPSHNSKFFQSDGIVLSCYAHQQIKGFESESSLRHYCYGSSQSFPSFGADTEKPLVYVPIFAPLNSLVLGTDTPPPNTFPVTLVGLTAKPSSDCAYTITNTAILTSLDSFNPFHNLLMLYRRLFAAAASFSNNAGDPGGMTDCTIVIWRGRPGDSDYDRFAAFDRSFFSSLCRAEVLQLSPRSAPMCFASLMVGATPGGWDMDIGPKKRTVGINFAGVALSSWLRQRLGAQQGDARGAVLVVRRGRREMVNEAAVRAVLVEAISPAPLDVMDFDQIDFASAFRILSLRAAMVGVHGAALCNLIFLPPGAALVEITISAAKTEFYFLALSFGRLYFEHASSAPMDEHLPDLRDRRVNVSDLPALGRLAARAVALVQTRAPSCC